MKYKKCLVLALTFFICLIINYLLFINYLPSAVIKRIKLTATPLEEINFKYLIHNKQCSGIQPFIVLLVTSFAGNIEARDAIRRAYPIDELRKLSIVRVFLLARLRKGQSRTTHQEIQYENDKYKDILLGNFYESYRNLTYKHLMGLQWASQSCSQARYIAKMDDDIVVDFYKLTDIVAEEEKKHNITLMGYFFGGMSVNRDRSNKWFVSKVEYFEEYYPAFLSGWLYITTPATAALLSTTSRTVPFFWIDDVYITGLLAKQANIPHQNISRYFSQHTEYVHCCIRNKLLCNLVAGPTNGYYALYSLFKRLTEDCRQYLCKPLPVGKSVKDYCIIKWQLPVDRGKSIIQQIQL